MLYGRYSAAVCSNCSSFVTYYSQNLFLVNANDVREIQLRVAAIKVRILSLNTKKVKGFT